MLLVMWRWLMIAEWLDPSKNRKIKRTTETSSQLQRNCLDIWLKMDLHKKKIAHEFLNLFSCQHIQFNSSLVLPSGENINYCLMKAKLIKEMNMVKTDYLCTTLFWVGIVFQRRWIFNKHNTKFKSLNWYNFFWNNWNMASLILAILHFDAMHFVIKHILEGMLFPSCNAVTLHTLQVLARDFDQIVLGANISFVVWCKLCYFWKQHASLTRCKQ